MQIDTVIYLQVTDPKRYTYGVDNPMRAIENLTATTLRNIIGDLELDQTLTSRDIINSKMRVIPVSYTHLSQISPFLDVTSDAWYAKAVAWAYENKIISGYDSTTFGPDDYVTTCLLYTSRCV